MRAINIPMGHFSDEDRGERWPASLTCLFVVGSSSLLWALIIGGIGWLVG